MINVVISEQCRRRQPQAQEHSIRMINLATQFVQRILALDLGDRNHFGFEWPKDNAGCKQPAMQQLQQLLPEVAEPDGCAYGLRGIAGNYIYKPWRMISTSRRLCDQLRPRCPGGHQHEQCRGRNAVISGLYSRQLVSAIINGMLRSLG